ncbi:hypothetical protein QFZ94_008007 [Paraburkholderia sp. JPY465]
MFANMRVCVETGRRIQACHQRCSFSEVGFVSMASSITQPQTNLPDVGDAYESDALRAGAKKGK